MAEAEDLLPLHYKKPLNQRQALAMAHLHFDPIQSQPFLSSVLKFMYRYLVISTSLAEEKEGNTSNFDKVLTNDCEKPPASSSSTSNRHQKETGSKAQLEIAELHKLPRSTPVCGMYLRWGLGFFSWGWRV